MEKLEYHLGYLKYYLIILNLLHQLDKEVKHLNIINLLVIQLFLCKIYLIISSENESIQIWNLIKNNSCIHNALLHVPE